MLTPTNEPEYHRQWAADQKGKGYCPFLRIKQKMMDPNEWMTEECPTDGKFFHNGSHYPLAVWTNNASSRSKEAWDRRQQKKKDRSKSAVAGRTWGAANWASW